MDEGASQVSTKEMKYKIVEQKPWFWSIVMLFFPEAEWGKVIMTFGNTIYVSRPILPWELIHEEVHVAQQHCSKVVGIFCLILYRISPRYRLSCEMEAYRREYLSLVSFSPAKSEQFRKRIASHLSSSLYGNMISYEDAYKLI